MIKRIKTKREKQKPKAKEKNFFPFLASFLARRFKARYFTTGYRMLILTTLLIGFLSGVVGTFLLTRPQPIRFMNEQEKEYWLELHRKSQKEYLYYGVEGKKEESEIVKSFIVKTGVPGQRPTPLPQALGKKYWKIIKKYPSSENPETAPYFLELDIPVEDGFFGPVPYNECDGQCFWERPGYFGLHGINGDRSKLAKDDPGSSGCIRHADEDITYLYNLLEVDEGVRYYIIDS